MPDVLDVEPEPLVEIRLAPALYLPEAGDARHDLEPVRVPKLYVLGAEEVSRGPTSDISPLTTLMSCGSSSRLVCRRIRPTRVIRGSFVILKSGQGRSLGARARRAPRR